jgi:hypothetical protein
LSKIRTQLTRFAANIESDDHYHSIDKKRGNKK